MTQPFRGRLGYAVVALAVIGLDRVTKAMIEAALAPYRSVPIIPGLFDLTLVQNPGGVFGLLKNLDAGFRGALFTIVPVAAIALIAAYARRVPPAQWITQTALALILGGAAGNLIDRIRLGYVVDFLDLHWRGHHWPAFNVADSAICAGVGLLMLETLVMPGSSQGAGARQHPVGHEGSDAP